MDGHDGLPTRSPMSVLGMVSLVVLFLLAVALFSIGSWYMVESFLDAYAGQCLGPVCIGGP